MKRLKEFLKMVFSPAIRLCQSVGSYFNNDQYTQSRKMIVPSRRKTFLKISIAALFGLLLVVAFGYIFYRYAPSKDHADGVWALIYNNAPWTLLTALATAPALLLTWYWRTFHKEAELRTAQEGQVTERFIKAVELLGQKSPAIKLGAIYALERIAKDSRDDHWTVMETLAAFIRQNAPYDPPRNEEGDIVEYDCPPVSAEIRNCIQAALTVIGRRRTDVEEKDRIDLKKTNLQGMRIKENFARADFKEANLNKADLWKANLQWANLIEANLQGAVLRDANLQGAGLYKANLQGAYLDVANLQGADLENANLQGARLLAANLQGAGLMDANLQGLYLGRAKLLGAKYNKKTTIFPSKFDPEKNGMILVNDWGVPIPETPKPETSAPESADEEASALAPDEEGEE
ncbi:MAG TPA: pentapeptide repeat-containing protein [bacterium]|nr:pentapeptide repeat-containing protein [bacterium]